MKPTQKTPLTALLFGLFVSLSTLPTASAAPTASETFVKSVNLLTQEKNLNELSRTMNQLADKTSDSQKAARLRLAARPESLAMTRAFLLSELERRDVNGIWLFMKGPYFCEYNNDTFEAATNCLVDIFATIITLGETNASSADTL